jgi:hypothetical protein
VSPVRPLNARSSARSFSASSAVPRQSRGEAVRLEITSHCCTRLAITLPPKPELHPATAFMFREAPPGCKDHIVASVLLVTMIGPPRCHEHKPRGAVGDHGWLFPLVVSLARLWRSSRNSGTRSTRSRAQNPAGDPAGITFVGRVNRRRGRGAARVTPRPTCLSLTKVQDRNRRQPRFGRRQHHREEGAALFRPVDPSGFRCWSTTATPS